MAAYIAITVESRVARRLLAVEQWEGVVYQEKHVAAMTLLALLRWRGWGGAHCADGARQLRGYSLWHPAGALLTGRIPPCLGDGLLWDDGRAFGEQSGTQWPL